MTAGLQAGRHAVFAELRDPVCFDGGWRNHRTGAQPGRGRGDLRRTHPDLRSALDGRSARIAPGGRPPRRRGARGGVRPGPRAPAQRRDAHGIRDARTSSARPSRGPAWSPTTAPSWRSTPTPPIRTTSPPPDAIRRIHMRRSGCCSIMWAKLDQPGAVYYDITWTHFCGETRRTTCSASSRRSRARAMPRSSA